MAEVMSRASFRLPDGMTGIREESFWDYLEWETGSKEIGKTARAFEDALKKATGFSDDRLPNSERTTPVRAGSYVFHVTTTPTTKTPAYADVVAGFAGYLDFLVEQRAQDEALRRGVRTWEGELYASLDVLEEKLQRDIRESVSGKEGVRQKIEPVAHVSAPNELVVSWDRSYGQLNKENAEAYLAATAFLQAWGSYAREFKQEVREDSLRALGTAPKSPVAVRYAFPEVAFYNHLEPRSRTAYKDVVDAFQKPVPEKVRKNSSAGDFPLIRTYVTGGTELKEKGLVDDKLLADYGPWREGGNIYVRLDGVRNRLTQYAAGEPFLEQNILARRR